MNVSKYLKENKKWLIIYLAVSLSVSYLGSNFADAQTVEVAPGVKLSATATVVVFGIGVIVAVARAAQGYDKSLSDFSWLKFGVEVWRVMVIAVPMAFANAIFNSEPSVYDYFTLFWTIWGLSSAWNKAKEESIPIDASDEEIAAIRKKRAGL